jgi:hypothetical protein
MEQKEAEEPRTPNQTRTKAIVLHSTFDQKEQTSANGFDLRWGSSRSAGAG